MRAAVRKGLSFGLTSSIITILGLLVGLQAGTGSKGVVVAGILVIALADSFSDALAMHVSEESANRERRDVWWVTFSTFGAKLFFALTFVLPVVVFSDALALWFSVAWGSLLLSLLSWRIALQQEERPLAVVGEHVLIMAFVVLLSYAVGSWVGVLFS